jgi:hypothetical protein
VAPKKTMFFAGVALKPVPVMVTVLPIAPDAGEKDVITGLDSTVPIAIIKINGIKSIDVANFVPLDFLKSIACLIFLVIVLFVLKIKKLTFYFSTDVAEIC